MKQLLFLAVLSLSGSLFAQFDLQEIMKGNDFVGYSPENVQWSIDNQTLTFQWNPDMEIGTSLYSYGTASKAFTKIPADQQAAMKPTFSYTQKRFPNYYFNQYGNLACYDYKTGKFNVIYSESESIGNIQRSPSGNMIFFEARGQLFCYDERYLGIMQVTNFVQGTAPDPEGDLNALEKQQRELFPYIRLQDEKHDWNEKNDVSRAFPKAVYYDKNQRIKSMTASFGGHFIAFVTSVDDNAPLTNYEAIITDDGYTKRKAARPKVGSTDPEDAMGIYDRINDSVYYVSFASLTDIRKKPEYLKLYGDQSPMYNKDRQLCIHPPVINETNNTALIDVRTFDNKDRWIVLLDFMSGKITELDHQHDEAWIGGPGISGWNEEIATLGWISPTVCYFQSEESGYSHLYTLNVDTKAKKALTSGNWEVYETILSQDNKSMYLIANKIHPGVRNGYQLDIASGKLTPLFEGNFGIEWSLSPDGKTWAIRYSTSTQPWDLYTAPNKPGAKMTRITTSQTEAFKQLPLQQPEIVTIPTSDGTNAYGRVYKPKTPNGAAILFVHGAGYLQNAHHYWSYYQREMLFHQKLASEGYTVIDLDYRASEGYGRKWRTDVYRHMGERDLNDYIDAKKYAVDQLGIDPNRVGIYGGSYGGFITLMGLLKTPGTFACGAALRSVTDWAHYNHEYTSNILNYPNTDPDAYRQSSPIYFAEGLQDPLLMLHGMVDDNVQFQDIVRLNQRFIELGKTNYTLSVFPTEAHGFTYTPAWVDEYRRIYELFNAHLLTK